MMTIQAAVRRGGRKALLAPRKRNGGGFLSPFCALMALAFTSAALAGGSPCGNPAAGDCLTDNGTPGCDDAICCRAVCSLAPFCCDIGWDITCVNTAETLCTGDPCTLQCEKGDVQEGEPCGDALNDGCNLDPPAFQAIECSQSICGTAWAESDARDTDWYTITTTAKWLCSAITSTMTRSLLNSVSSIPTSYSRTQPSRYCSTSRIYILLTNSWPASPRDHYGTAISSSTRVQRFWQTGIQSTKN